MSNSSVSARAPGTARPTARPVFTTRDLLVTVYYHRRLMFVAFAVAMLVGIVAAAMAETRFDAQGRLLVLFGREQSGEAEMIDQRQILHIDGVRAIEAELEILRSREVVELAVATVGPVRLYPELGRARLFGLLPEPDGDDRLRRAIERVDRDLRAAVGRNSNLVLVSFPHRDPDVGVEFVDSLFITYLSRRRDIFRNPRAPVLRRETAGYRDEIARVEDEIQDVKRRFDVLDLRHAAQLAADRLDQIDARRHEVLEQRRALEGEIETARARLRAMPRSVLDFRETSDRPDSDEARSILARLQVERETLRQRFQPEYPRLREIESEIAAIQEFLSGDRHNYTTSREVRNPALAFLDNRMVELELKLNAALHQLEEIDDQRRGAAERIARLREAERRLTELERARDVLDNVYREYAVRAETTRIEEDAAELRASNVRVVDWGTAPARGRNLAMHYLTAGLLGGLVFAVAAAVAGDWTRQVLITPREAERALGIPVLASFAAGGRPFADTEGREEMMYFAARLVDRSGQDPPVRVIQVVSGDDREGRSELIRALATELAAGHGCRTLLVDLTGDGERAANALGADSAAVVTAPGGVGVCATRTAGLSVTRGAPATPLGRHRADLEVIRASLEGLAAGHDFVLIDAPPAGETHLAVRLAALVDASILVVRAEHTRQLAAASLSESILDAGGDILGLALTGRGLHVPKLLYRWI